jgi:hypothetical protein
VNRIARLLKSLESTMTYAKAGPRTLSIGIALILAVALPAISEETRIEQIEQELTTISKFAVNARSKLANGVIGSPTARTTTSKLGPAQICCSVNLERMDESIKDIGRIVRELESCYVESANEGAMAMSSVFVADLASFSRAVDGFGDSSSPHVAQNRLGAMTRLFIILSDSLELVEDCPAVTSETAPADADADSSDSKSDSKKKKKKKQSPPDDSTSR